MSWLARWLADRRWASAVRHAREYRRELSFSQRELFDRKLRPRIKGEPDKVIAYPDAIYHITMDDLCRAMIAGAIGDKDGE
jgi:hypothetical protein